MLSIMNCLLAWINGFVIGVLGLAVCALCVTYYKDSKTTEKSYEAKNDNEKEASFGFKGKYEYQKD